MIEEILKKYLNDSKITELFDELLIKQRVNILTEDVFIKIGTNDKEEFYDTLVKEIKLYEKNQKNSSFPEMLEFYYDNDRCIIVLKRIGGRVLGKSRNEFTIEMSKEERETIIKDILKIKEISIDSDNEKNYDRFDQFNKYFERAKEHLTALNITFLTKIKDEFYYKKENRVLSHGDLIAPNIMIEEGKVKFIDWEFIGYRTKTYDIAYFLLFSTEENCFEYAEKIEGIDKKELFKDGIVICLKEIQNWNKLFGEVDDKIVNKKINRWKKELDLLINGY